MSIASAVHNRHNASYRITKDLSQAQIMKSAKDEAENVQTSEKLPYSVPLPKLRLHIQNLDHPGASRFLEAVEAAKVLSSSATTVVKLLYISPAFSDYKPPPMRSVTLYLQDMDGVAYTKSSDLDEDHKEIHFSLEYIKNIKTSSKEKNHKSDLAGAYEIRGVLVHELVHCFQYNGKGKCPGGLVEGIADWVRLKAGLGAIHWKRSVPERWDQGYEKTAYFLEWLEGRFGEETVRRMNELLRKEAYDEKEFWDELFGKGVDNLFEEYINDLEKKLL
ncbi:hypothetical protein O181_054432 [Austropuccinia psidii MF-1]|uniref:Plant basic secretory protein n=1 Tax=Austropuccinia psidii MF-1 TaxID=1389203 RepID=A0A9Q3E6X7_9BASI|nr:hypothetical protein [Austropuccinia psidii MF-1]